MAGQSQFTDAQKAELTMAIKQGIDEKTVLIQQSAEEKLTTIFAKADEQYTGMENKFRIMEEQAMNNKAEAEQKLALLYDEAVRLRGDAERESDRVQTAQNVQTNMIQRMVDHVDAVSPLQV